MRCSMANWRIKNMKSEEILDISKSVFKVGRNVNADLTSVNSALSRNHATLSILIDGFLYVQDNKSCNGTFVNNRKIPVMEMVLLNQGDIIGFGSCQEICEDENIEIPPLIFEVQRNGPETVEMKTLEEDQNNKIFPDLSRVEFSKDSIDCIIISDGEDDKDEFNNSQLYKFSEEIKKEQTSHYEGIDPYAHIKQELEDLDYCNNFPSTVDLTDDLETCQSTRDLLDILESPGPSKKNESLEQECSSSTTVKPKYIKPPIVEPHVLNKGKNIVKKKPLEENNSIKVTESRSKRKNSDPSLEAAKKNKASCSFVETKCDKKSISDEFKKRGKTKSGTVHKKEIDKESKQAIQTERKKKLKEISERDSGKNCHEPAAKISKPTSKVKVSTGRGEFLLEVSTTTKSENYTNDLIPSTSKWSPEADCEIDNCSISVNKECNKITSHEKKKDGQNDQIIQDTTISSNFSSQRDANRPHISDSLTVTHKTFSFQKPDSVCNEYGLIWKATASSYKPPPPTINKNIVNVDDEICKMVYWPVQWLREQRNSDISPPINGEKQLMNMPLCFGNFSYYYNIVTPLITLEMWQYIYQTLYNKDEARSPVRIFMNHKRRVGGLTYLDCECYITEEDVRKNNIFRTDDFAIIEMKLKDASNYYIYDGFAYIKFCRRTELKDDMIINKEAAELCSNIPHTNVKFTVVTRNLSEKEIIGKLVVIKVIANVASYLRLIKTVKYLETSRICKQVLHPTIENYRISAKDNNNLIVEVNLNSQQKEIVLEACTVCLRDDPGLYLIKGPPGTGKSTVIINIVLQILLSGINSDKRHPLILLTAPSNAAVDNLILKLAETRAKLTDSQKKFLRLVRIGPDSSISKSVDKFKLSSLARNHILKDSRLSSSEEFKVALEKGIDMEQFLKKHLGHRYFYDMKCTEDVLLFGSNVICTTLTSCVSSRILDSCRRDQLKFSCCIVDEATQCSEAELLLPIQLGIDKFILVGDPQQLPAVVCNKDAQKLGFGKSLFARIDENFKKYKNSPVKMLCEQYRMKPEICEYPNKIFYRGQLKSFPIHANKIVPELKPYLLFNLVSTENQDNSDYTNLEEAQLIYNILDTLQKSIQSNCKYSLGIITPYRAQKDLLMRQVSNIRFNTNVSVTVNTVDSFQGMENDVIIISCVRYNPNYFLQSEQRLNVALTRARQALYIIGSYTLFKHCRLLYDLREDAKKRKLCIDINRNFRNINLHKFQMLR